MLRVLLLVLFSSLYFLLVTTFSVVFDLETIPLTIAPLIIAFSIFFQNSLEGFSLVFIMGFILDAFSTMPIGVSSAVLLLLWFANIAAIAWLGKPDWLMIFILMIAISFVYRVAMYFIQYVIFGHAGFFPWVTILWAPTTDAVIGICLIRFLHNLLVRLKLVEPIIDISSRLSSRKMQKGLG
jgi:hypothetical protein